jgi:putative effector of murein hydrolase LrgA (UPF0299 family)
MDILKVLGLWFILCVVIPFFIVLGLHGLMRDAVRRELERSKKERKA